MEMAKRARTAQTPKQTSHPLRPYAPHFYPENLPSGFARGEEGNLLANSTSTPSERRSASFCFIDVVASGRVCTAHQDLADGAKMVCGAHPTGYARRNRWMATQAFSYGRGLELTGYEK